MAFILALIFWFAGLMIASFTLIPVLIIFVFGVPTTRKLERVGAVAENNGIIRRYIISVVILLFVFAATLLLTRAFFPNELIALSIGMGMALLSGLSKLGNNMDNVTDYLGTNGGHLRISVKEAILVIMGHDNES